MYGKYANIGGILSVNCTIYSSTMDPMGMLKPINRALGHVNTIFQFLGDVSVGFVISIISSQASSDANYIVGICHLYVWFMVKNSIPDAYWLICLCLKDVLNEPPNRP